MNINTSMKKTPDHLFHIPALFCPKCDEWRDFYINDSAAFCDCCHEQLTASDKDIEAVSGRSPRAPILRFSNRVAVD